MEDSMRKKIHASALFLFVFLFILSIGIQSACAVVVDSDISRSSRSIRHKEELHKSFPLDSDGRFSLKNVNGSIVIETWSRNKVDIYAVKATKYDRENLRRVHIEIESSRNEVAVDTIYERRRNIRAWVDYEIKVPEGVELSFVRSVNGNVHLSGGFSDVTARTTNGRIELENAAGDINLASTNGGIKAYDIMGNITARSTNGGITLEILTLEDDIKASSTNGGISIRLRDGEDIHADLRARTTNGTISFDFPITIHSSRISKRYIEGRIGDGGIQIDLSTTNGSIRIR
jgi:hypothetical protein